MVGVFFQLFAQFHSSVLVGETLSAADCCSVVKGACDVDLGLVGRGFVSACYFAVDVDHLW